MKRSMLVPFALVCFVATAYADTPGKGMTEGHAVLGQKQQRTVLSKTDLAVCHHETIMVSLAPSPVSPKAKSQTIQSRKDAAVSTRKRILATVADEQIPAIGYHMPFLALGFVERSGDSFRWVPASYQFNL